MFDAFVYTHEKPENMRNQKTLTSENMKVWKPDLSYFSDLQIFQIFKIFQVTQSLRALRRAWQTVSL